MDGAFVIQEHDSPAGRHYDIMLERAGGLLTFQSPLPPHELAAGGELTVARLADHRRVYLEYEGPLTGGRGTVRIVDRGAYQALQAGEDCWLVRLAGGQTHGLFEFLRLQGQRYRLSRKDR